MTLTKNQCDLLLGMVTASIERATQSGIPIHREYYDDIETIKREIYQEMRESIHRENEGVRHGINH